MRSKGLSDIGGERVKTSIPSHFIRVDNECIRNAVRKDSQHCMIADAVAKALPKMTWIRVDVQSIRFTDRENALRFYYFTPLTAQRKLLEWDEGKNVKPFSFSISVGIVKPYGHSGGIITKDKKKINKGNRNPIGMIKRRTMGLCFPQGVKV